MDWEEIQQKLRYKLAELCPSDESIRSIVKDVDSKLVAFINWRGKPADIWSDVLSQARTRGLEIKLIKAARREYPQDKELQKAEKATIFGKTPEIYKDEHITKLITIVESLSIPDEQLIEMYRKCTPTEWTHLPWNLKNHVQNLADARINDYTPQRVWEFAKQIANQGPNAEGQILAWMSEVLSYPANQRS